MPLSFAQLTAPSSSATVSAQLLAALQGLGYVTQAGPPAAPFGLGTGTLALSSAPSGSAFASSATLNVVVKIIASGEPGAATFQYSLDAGSTYSSTQTSPASGSTFTLPNTGVKLAFAAGASGAGTSFVASDTYSFPISTPNFPVTSWQSGSVPRTLVNIDAQALADFSSLISAVAAGGLLYRPDGTLSATGAWLDLLGTYVYGLPRNLGVVTKGTIVLTDALSAGPFSIPAGAMYAASSSGLRFYNTTTLSLSKGSTVSGVWAAEAVGSAYNVANSNITTIVANTLPGVTVNNPDAGSGTWITTQQGTDDESDTAYASRCAARWPALGPSATAAVYDLWARTAASAITRTVVVADPTTPGQADIYCAGASGPAGGSDVTAANTYIQQRVPLCVAAVVQAATGVAVTVQGTINYRASVTTSSAIQSAISTNLTAFFQTLALGKDSGGTVKVRLAALVEQIMLASGAENVVLSLPAADVALTLGQVATLTLSFGSWTFNAV